MKCYYEELGIARDANDGDIKSAYRKLALRWHPDKNLDCLEEAKERFQLIQQAYEVLSDAHERAWYDNHREQIIRGKNSDYEENCLDVFQYFTVSCFKGYGDDIKGFYAVYSEVFQKIAAEDAEFMEDEEEIARIPKFGDSQSNYEEVVGPFYAYWQAYCTKKTYTWLCPYDIQEIKDRRILREVEKELKKIVQKAKKERNEEVRNLISFIRKRDKRVQTYRLQLEERAAINRQKQEQNRLDQIRKRRRELEETRRNTSHSFNESYEEQLKQLELHYGGDSNDEEEYSDDAEELENEADYVDDLYCVACNKAFKNENAFANHETSKKHRDIMERMKKEMLDDEEAYEELHRDEDAVDGSEKVDATVENEADVYMAIPVDEEEESEETAKPLKKNKKNKKIKKGIQPNSAPKTSTSDNEQITSDNTTQANGHVNSDEEDWNNSSKKGARKNKNKKQTKKPAISVVTKIPVETAKDTVQPAPTVKLEISTDATTPTQHVCVTCHAIFPSKNKLFAHLKITNHGVHIPKPKQEPGHDSKNKKANSKRK